MPWSFLTGKHKHEHQRQESRVEEEEEEEEGGLYRRVPFTRHIVAVGDMHGDMPNARKVLTFAGVVDEHGNWSGDVDYFVQTGDIIDRGDDTILLFLWMERLRVQAAHARGTVLSHLGNHEWMNAIGDWRYVYPSELATFGSIAARQRMLTTGRIGRAWATNYTTASRLPLHPSLGPPNTPYPPHHLSINFQKDSEEESIFHHTYEPLEDDHLSHAALSFVHGGLSPSYSNLSPFPTRINELSDSLLYKLQNRPQPSPHPPSPYPGLPHETTHAEAELYSSNGPLWYRGWATEDDETVCSQVDEVLRKTGTRRMIMGHTPDFHNIKSRCNGKIIIIDTGISHAYGGVLSALSIHYTMIPIGGADSDWWIEKEVVSALYEDRQEVIVTEEREIVGSFRHDES
ncbi:Metallo-dependent phosphatase [Pholiota conissans]|uniref:Metallo-dependent phosphatase n=1 Tax=Pholiota conissans TaxID=109636 RepID=A0A9P6CTP4_9AGAR|nr:Metallo-dependent phosphatase [Pholiota conissans]